MAAPLHHASAARVQLGVTHTPLGPAVHTCGTYSHKQYGQRSGHMRYDQYCMDMWHSPAA